MSKPDVSEEAVEKLARWAENCAISEGLGRDYANAFRELRRQLSEKEAEAAKMSDSNAVHISMLAGAIAKPSVEQINHIYGGIIERAVLAGVKAGIEATKAGAKIHIHIDGRRGGIAWTHEAPEAIAAKVKP